MNGSYIALTIIDIVKETSDTSTFIVRPDNGYPLIYRPGQFITLIFDKAGDEMRRSYSVSSTPGIDKDISFTVKRIHNGEISRLLSDHYKPGDKLYTIAPAGMFIYEDDDTAKDVFLLGAGSGITPVYSLLKHILYFQPAANVHLVYQNTTERSTIFRQALQKLQEDFPNRFNWIDYVSRPEKSTTSRKLTNDRLEALIPQLMRYKRENALFYICGPLSFMRMCQFTILLMKFRKDQIRKEYFVIDPAPPPPLVAHPSEKNVIIHREGRQQDFKTLYPSTILQSALNRQIALPYSCKGGKCSACVARCIKGKVVMSMNDVLTEKDIQQGLILTCVGYAATDIEISYE